MPEVLKGIINQSIECCLIPVGSMKGTMPIEQNRLNNWNAARELCNNPIFVGMDSDVVLVNSNAIKILINELQKNEFDMITLPTKEWETEERNRTPHSVFAVWKEKFPELKPDNRELKECVVCYAIRNLKIKCFYNLRQREVKRI